MENLLYVSLFLISLPTFYLAGIFFHKFEEEYIKVSDNKNLKEFMENFKQ